MDRESVAKARKTDLARFLLRHYPDRFKVVGTSSIFKEHDSISIRFGYCGYTRFSSQETGNSIDFLVRYLGYTFQDAVRALLDEDCVVESVSAGNTATAVSPVLPRTFVVPEPAAPPWLHVLAYLCKQRNIPQAVVEKLFADKLLYEDSPWGNAVFISRKRDFCEVRGTSSTTAFHGIRRTAPDCFWSMRNSTERPQVAYICEGAIDAVSLYCLHSREGLDQPAAYVGIGGVRNQQTIQRIQALIHTVLAVDNDEAGQQCRERNPDIPAIIPVHKDWNEDLQYSLN